MQAYVETLPRSGQSQTQTELHTLRLISYNIQVGIHSNAYRHYFTRGWQHLLPHPSRTANLDQIAHQIRGYDIVALQEVDGGSIRSNHMNQVEYLAESAHYRYWFQQLNRNLGKIAQHSNGMLSRFKPNSIEDHKLPGLVPGRGAILMEFGETSEKLMIVLLHLSLGARARTNQLAYINERLQDYRHIIVMGDLNTETDNLLHHSPLCQLGLHTAEGTHHTYPSWRPSYRFDHILLSPSITLNETEVLHPSVSDHLPITMEVAIPKEIVIRTSVSH